MAPNSARRTDTPSDTRQETASLDAGSGRWKSAELTLRDTLTPTEVQHQAHAQVRIIAAEAGEFVHDIRIGLSATRSEGWRLWRIDYLPGPPTAGVLA